MNTIKMHMHTLPLCNFELRNPSLHLFYINSSLYLFSLNILSIIILSTIIKIFTFVILFFVMEENINKKICFFLMNLLYRSKRSNTNFTSSVMIVNASRSKFIRMEQ